MGKWAVLGLAILLNAGANVLIKAAMRSLGGLELSLPGVVRAALNPYMVGGVAAFGLALGAYAMVLSRFPLSVGYPVMTSLGLVVVAAASVTLFGETFGAARLGGTLLILAGVALVARSA